MVGGEFSQSETHWYPLPVPRGFPWLPVALAVLESAFAVWDVARGKVPVGPIVTLVLLVVVVIAARRARSRPTNAAALGLSPLGVQFGLRHARWDEIDRIERRPPLMRIVGRPFDAFILKHPKPISKALVVSGRYERIDFGYTYRRWQSSGIADDIRRWAPQLLQPR